MESFGGIIKEKESILWQRNNNKALALHTVYWHY
jgi:hypothetical protein